MYAVIRTGGKQYRVSPGDRVKVERLEADEGSPVVFGEVLLVGDGSEVRVGTPLVEDAQVRATALGQGRGKKVIVYKFKRRKGYHKKQGHRQDYTLVQIDEVVMDSESRADEGATSDEEVAGIEESSAPENAQESSAPDTGEE